MEQFFKSSPSIKKIENDNKLLIENETLLLIMDLQEKILNNIKGNQLLIFNIKKLIKSCNLLNVPIAFSEQNPLKLGSTLESILDKKEYPKFEKMEFSCSKNKNFSDYVNKYCFKNIIVCGIESHICVLQTSIELLEQGFNILIPRDAIGSRNEIDNDTAFLRLILSGAVPSTTESLICELCKTAKRKEFKEVSKILKNSFSN
ncbi:isochorismatase family protein [Prochlorococcus marinus]|uniref:Isochorismatase n=1 Tax=Prochlorococcus marinus XMU1408 TaxID=2213228 RepID=A0A318R4M3_PROMR|nr:isochorismatase family protein [Prochlorococcus marinus]MBW3041665.1 isochorismatase [Prochlorococcus marinus str. XMU1408]PYE02818.1 isochorismatase [Prochlorococcus marinus XMU1408]